MTLAPENTGGPASVPAPIETVALTIDGIELSVPKGTLIIRAAELLGIQVPRFCDHPLLDPVGACRQCIVEVEGQRKPVASCTVAVTDGMVVRTQLTSPVAEKAQAGTMELLLINHPLDCPICDKGGECPLQNQAMTSGRADSRFTETKRTYPKPLAISTEVLLDRERCVLCTRCTRFSEQIAGDPFIEMFERGAAEQVAVFADAPFSSVFSGNTVQVCPVGALTSASYRFRSRPFDLVSTPSVCEHCADGCSLRTDHRRGKVTRRLAGDDPLVNEEWNCDKGRFAFRYGTLDDRITTPLVRDRASGRLVPASWSEALLAAADGLRAVRDAAPDASAALGVLAGGRLTVEDAYAYGKFARRVLGTDSVDFRARPGSAEEAAFLAHAVAGSGLGVTYTDLETMGDGRVVLVGLEPEDESPILFLRLRKAVRNRRLAVEAIAPFATRGLAKLSGTLHPTAPGREAEALDALELPAGCVLLLGERLAESPGALSAAVRAAERTGARLAWVPRRAGDRGAVEAGLLPGLLPGGRSLAASADRAELARLWELDELALTGGADAETMVSTPRAGYVVGGVDLADLPDPAAAAAALAGAAFVLSLEQRHSSVTEHADVVLPVATVAEKAGAFLDWEGRVRLFDRVLDPGTLPDGRVLHMVAEEIGTPLDLPNHEAARAELDALAGTDPAGRAPAPTEGPRPVAGAGRGELVLATHAQLLDDGRLSDGEPHLAGTQTTPVARLSPATARSLGLAAGEQVAIATDRGTITLPLAPTEMPDDVVWVPTTAPGRHVRGHLAARAGDRVRVGKGSV